jgi:LPS sulfotransferase NodH
VPLLAANAMVRAVSFTHAVENREDCSVACRRLIPEPVVTHRIQKRFVLFSTPRSGSSHIVSLLDSHPEITCLGELFNLNGAVLRDLGMKSKKMAWTVGTAPLEFLQKVVDLHDAKHNCKPLLGFKMMLHHDPRVVDFILEQMDWKVIVLERQNKLAQWSSMKMAMDTGEWSANKGDAPVAEQPKVVFDARNFEQYCFRMTAKYESIYHRLGSRPYLRLFCEEIDQRHRDILEYLEVDATLADQLDSRRERQNPSDIRDRIKNYDAYVRYAQQHAMALN